MRALHFHDAAQTAARLVGEANRQGMRWGRMSPPSRPVFPAPASARTPAGGPDSKGSGSETAVEPVPTGRADSSGTGTASTAARLVGRGATAVERASGPLRGRAFGEYLRLRASRYDLLHVHGGHKAAAARWCTVPVAVHLHGSDIRVMQYTASGGPSVRRGVSGADLAVYATPDLGEHLAHIRSDGHYLPVPIPLRDLPSAPPLSDRSGVLFVSRWEAAKGGSRMLEVAAEIRRRAPEIPLRGLDWGDGTGEARRLGVELLAKRPHEEYLALLAESRVAVGQSNPMIGSSELEALGLGMPLIAPFRTDWYEGLGKLAGDDPAAQADAVIAANRDPAAAAREQAGREYVERRHDTPVVLSRLLELYRTVL
jgi:glycosyltransferase involved in cell wall biosynthesis